MSKRRIFVIFTVFCMDIAQISVESFGILRLSKDNSIEEEEEQGLEKGKLHNKFSHVSVPTKVLVE